MSDGTVLITHGTADQVFYYGGGAAASVLLESKFFDLDGYTQVRQYDPRLQTIGALQKTLTGVLLEIDQGVLTTVQLYVGVKQRLKDVAIWYGPYSLANADEMIHTLDVEDARFFAFRIVDLTPISIWQVSAMELYGLIGEGRK